MEKALGFQQKVIELWNILGIGWPASGKYVYQILGLPVRETCRVSHAPITDKVRRNLERVFE
jgi:dihydrodipicolinate synthase/N-acetylneuraminate lyase